MLIDKEQDQIAAMADIAPLLPGLHKVLHGAFAFYQGGDYSVRARAEHSDRAAANNVYSHADQRWLSEFDGFPGAAFLNVRGLHLLNYRDLVVVRLKKIRGNGRHSNYQTQQQRDYDGQRPIPGLPQPARRLTAGYELDASGSSIERIVIARPIGRHVFWTSQVNVVDGAPHWVDITPPRFAGTGNSDFRAERMRRGHEQ